MILNVSEIASDPIFRAETQQALVRSMITLSHDLGYRVVAEGVETEPAVAILVGMECEDAQGYYFARPMEVVDFNGWLASRCLSRSTVAA